MSNGWTKSTEKLLRNWSQITSINESEFRKRGVFYRNWYWGIGIVLVITQTGSVATIANLILNLYSQETTADATSEATVLTIVGIIEALILIAQGLDKFFNFGSASEQYFTAAKDYNSLSRTIDTTLTLSRADRGPARDVLISIRQKFDQLQDTSPNLPPNAVVHRLDMCIYDDPEQARGNAKTGIVNLGDGQGLPIEEVLNESPPPEHAKKVKFPKGTDSDDEHVKYNQKLNLETEFQGQKKHAELEHQKTKRLKNLEYQWRRMQEHADDEVKSPPRTKKTLKRKMSRKSKTSKEEP